MSLQHNSLLTAAALALTLVGASAQAQTAIGNFKVVVTVQKACAVTSATDINFGTKFTSDATADTKNNTLNITCSKKTPYTIALTPASTSSATGVGNMILQTAGNVPVASPTADQLIAYKLLKASGGAAWGNTGADVYSTGTTGTGAPQPFSVFATVAGGTAWNVEPGNYADTVKVEVIY